MATDIASFDPTVLGREPIQPIRTPSQLIWRRFRKHRMAVIGMAGFAVLLLFIIVGPFFVSETSANTVELTARLGQPSAKFWMGTDSTGRDIFARIIYGGQISLFCRHYFRLHFSNAWHPDWRAGRIFWRLG